ncbi:MAG: type II toxin-antitoxin system HipA family toxin [Methylotenera sp.]|nr:type II toxin-antitoxin system HipA family toxin [Methylotenera sp.]MDO9234048.1 type II toxin-antitoxin system HipA family toxin [Methylotenera sp.]MDO9388733.1 type II toxin-antitoxin system HipA family toxin [Methylotenera sp.]MDP1596133.1 type II toxin-antitoxin system HipA family toxin [Methylotenera sp.]MDP1755459.1 type II toxin-antitoxin system HipA family toxin [Methylotenera sp.]
MSSDSLFVWVYLPSSSKPVVSGRLDISITAAGKLGKFTYGKSYLSKKDAIPLDPVTLPLSESIHEFTALKGFPGIILDSCPDRWGIKVIDRLVGQMEYPVGYILLNDPGRAGALAFSLSAKDIPKEMDSREFKLNDLMHAAEAVEKGLYADPELLKALHPGTGGARPKCNIVDGNSIWIAKFPSIDDSSIISVPRLEHATMTLADLCGIRVAKTKIEVIDGRDVCFVKRFDRELTSSGILRTNYLSARSVFFGSDGYESVGTGSYGRLARQLQKYGCPIEEKHELYRRMVFNVAVRNSDDHELNHGLIHYKHGDWRLSPAFDIVPTTVFHHVYQHAILIGDSAAGTISNLLSNAEAFELSQAQAKSVINDVQSLITDNWIDTFYSSGFGDESIRNIERCFSPIPLG